MKAQTKLPTVQVALFNGFDELDAVGPYKVLGTAGFEVSTVGWDAAADGKVTGNHGLVVDAGRDQGAYPGLLVVPGGGWLAGSGVRELVADRGRLAWLRQAHSRGTVLVSVCTGALVLAYAGLLAGRPAVTNMRALDDLRAAGADVQADARVVDDGDVVTCGGPTAGIDLALRLVQRYLGEAAADEAEASIEYRRQGPVLVTGSVNEAA